MEQYVLNHMEAHPFISELPKDIAEMFAFWLDASKAYYDLEDEALISDDQFDDMTKRLSDWASLNHDGLFRVLTTKIQTTEGMVSATEVKTEMVSLKKITLEEGKYSLFVNEILRFMGPKLVNGECVIGPKLDGAAIKIIKDTSTWKVRQILTRGGQDYTNILRNHPDIVALQDARNPIIHGELVLPKKIFLEKWSDTYANPRNGVNGVVKQKEHINDLRFVVTTDGTNPCNDYWAIWEKFWEPGKTPDYMSLLKKFKDDSYPFLVDGLVIAYNTDTRIIKDNYPLNMVSLKFPSPEARSKVIGMEWSQKKSGNLTPTYLLEPTMLDGVEVKRANGYNYDTIKKLKCGIGSEVIITRNNEIMPAIKRVLTPSNDIKMPEIDYTINGKHLVAVNMEASMEYRFVLGFKLLQLEGFGDTLAQHIGTAVGHDIVEVFNLANKTKIMSVIGEGKTWEKFLPVYDTKNIPLDQLIEMLQFNRCGKVLSKKFAQILTGKTIDTSGIEKNVLLYVCKGEGKERINKAMSRLKEFGIRVIKPLEINENTITYEMSNSPVSGITKGEFKDRMKKIYPNSTHTSLTKETKYLIVDTLSASSSKANKARKFNIKMVTYEEALKGNLT